MMFERGGDRHIYVLNIDYLFLINFVMNLYLFTLTAKSLKRTATRIRVFVGSFAGTVLFCVLLLTPGLPGAVKRWIGPMVINMSVTAVVFRIRQAEELLWAAGYLFGYAFVLGGFLKFLLGVIPFLKDRQMSIWMIMGAGLIGYEMVSWWLAQVKRKKTQSVCVVRISGQNNSITVKALIDTGNSLREPISGKPVSIVEEEVFNRLEGARMPEKLRMIPFHSVGKSNGMMEGYELPELLVGEDRDHIRWQKVIVGISKEPISANGKYQMILHPELNK